MKVLITGATGLVGKRLVQHFAGSVHALSRDVARASQLLPGARIFEWDGVSRVPSDAFQGVDAVLHLAGEPVAAARWSAAQKAKIRDSRVLGTRALVDSLRDLATPPRVLLSASGVGYYGSRGATELSEEAQPGADFLAQVCIDWENAAQAAQSIGVRVASLRTGMVLAKDGGALAKLLPVFRSGLGGRLGSGQQWLAWIHIQDLVQLFVHALEHPELSGPLNACAPNPVTNAEFTRVLAQILHRPAFLPVPEAALRIALGNMTEALVASQRALPTRAQKSGFSFAFPQLQAALSHVLHTG